MIVSFTGTRKGMTETQKRAVRAILSDPEVKMVVHGAAIGADNQFDEIAVSLKLRRIVFPSNMPEQSALHECLSRGSDIIVQSERDPLERNKFVVDMGHLLLATPTSLREQLRSGTWSTIRYARRVGKIARIIGPDGKD